MSRIWAPLPTPNPLEAPPAPAGARWWRRLLPLNDDMHHLMVYAYPDRGGSEMRLGCWEFFDGLDVQLVFGHDVLDVRFSNSGGAPYIDVLAEPLPLFESGHWAMMPDDGYQDGPFSQFVGALPALPFRYAPHVTGGPEHG